MLDSGRDGDWADALLASETIAAPHLMPIEVTNILRRAVIARDLSADAASLAHADLLALSVTLLPYAPFAGRDWELRTNLTAYDAWYVAIAETLDARLATLDHRLTRSTGPRCTFLTLPGGR